MCYDVVAYWTPNASLPFTNASEFQTKALHIVRELIKFCSGGGVASNVAKVILQRSRMASPG
jgi:hypothetical protein